MDIDTHEFGDLPRDADDLVFGVAYEFVFMFFNLFAYGFMTLSAFVLVPEWEVPAQYLPLGIVAANASYAYGQFALVLIDYRRYYELETTKSWAVLSFPTIPGPVGFWDQARAAEAYLIENAVEYFDVLDLRDVSAWRQEPHTRSTTLAVAAVGFGIAGGTLWFFFGGGADLHRLTGLSIASLTWCLFGVSCLALAGILYSDVDTVRPIDWHTSVLIGVMRLFPLGIIVTLIVLTNQLATLRAMYADPKLPPWYLLQICLTLSVGVLAAAHYLLLAYDSMQLRQQSVA